MGNPSDLDPMNSPLTISLFPFYFLFLVAALLHRFLGSSQHPVLQFHIPASLFSPADTRHSILLLLASCLSANLQIPASPLCAKGFLPGALQRTFYYSRTFSKTRPAFSRIAIILFAFDFLIFLLQRSKKFIKVPMLFFLEDIIYRFSQFIPERFSLRSLHNLHGLSDTVPRACPYLHAS